jgi:gamma-D-glutamyl-L-lysine dipeptidyl-peptidase
MYAKCIVSIGALTRDASFSSEMISQLVYGEVVQIIEEKNNKWLKVVCLDDAYTGYAMKNQLQLVDETAINLSELIVTNHMCSLRSNNVSIQLPIGSKIDKIEFRDFEGEMIAKTQITCHTENIIKYAKRLLGTAYVWGGKTSFGIDCSGFTQLVYKLNGILLPRDAYQQAIVGRTIASLSEAISGDLVYFEDTGNKIIHVGILVNNYEVIHCAGDVHIDTIDDLGIINNKTKERTHQLSLIKRVV